MCDKLPYCNPRLDSCLTTIISKINKLTSLKTIASCCGHGKYAMSIVVKDKDGEFFELISKTRLVKRKRNYYKKDDFGFYYIPELRPQ